LTTIFVTSGKWFNWGVYLWKEPLPKLRFIEWRGRFDK